jgi:hypothetical protein
LLLPNSSHQSHSIIDIEGLYGLEFHSKNIQEFKLLNEYIKNKKEEAILESYANEANYLLTLLESNTDSFIRSLILCDHPDSKYSQVPILSYIDPSDFMRHFLNLPPSYRRKIAYAFEERYKKTSNINTLVDEVNFLNDLICLLETETVKRAGKMSAHTLRGIINSYLRKALDNLQTVASSG